MFRHRLVARLFRGGENCSRAWKKATVRWIFPRSHSTAMRRTRCVFGGSQGRGGVKCDFSLFCFFLKTGWRLGGEMDGFCWAILNLPYLRFHSAWSVCFWGPNTKPQELALLMIFMIKMRYFPPKPSWNFAKGMCACVWLNPPKQGLFQSKQG